jgi:tRNA(Ile)-lysidine synthetase-like protein
MDAIVQRLKDYVRRYGLPRAGEAVLVACSGGADSLALLFLLHEMRAELGISIACAHYEHGLRGEESLREMHFTEARARTLQIPFYSEHGGLSDILDKEGGNAEARAREMRYAFLERTRRGGSYDRIALAHTADDQAETVLYKFLRGSSLGALAGIPPVRERHIRPLLFAGRDEAEAYLHARGQVWCEDSSNKTSLYKRNILRNTLLPELEKHFPALRRHLGELADESSSMNRGLESLADRIGLAAREEEYARGVSWPLQALQEAPPFLARHVLSGRLSRQARRSSDLPRRAWYLAFERRLAQTGREGGLLYHGAAGTVYIYKERVYCTAPLEVSLYESFSGEYVFGEGEFSFPWGRLRVTPSRLPETADKKFFQGQAAKGILYLSTAALAARSVIRSVRPGERFELCSGMSKKVAAILAESGVPLPLRSTALVLAPGAGHVQALFVPAMLWCGRIGSGLYAEAGQGALRLEFALPEKCSP